MSMQAKPSSLPNPNLDRAIPFEVERRIFHRALMSRRVDEKVLDLFADGKLFGTVHTCIGQEMTGAVLSEWILPKDSIFSNHRCHGHFLSTRGNAGELLAELMGKSTGVCGGLGGSQHLCKNGFFSNGIQGGIVPVSAGIALGKKMKGEGALAFVFIGDGTMGEGAVYEALNIAAKWELPLFIVLENNGYAQSTSQTETLAGEIVDRSRAFGICFERSSTWDWKELWKLSDQLISGARRDGKPVFLQIDTFRLKAHSKGDDNRPTSEVQEYGRIDPLNLLLAEKREDFFEISKTIDREISAGISAATAAPYATYAQMPTLTAPLKWQAHRPRKLRTGVAINEAFHVLMNDCPEVLFLGEDVLSPYGGAFKISQGLSDAFPGRVRNMPISEAAIAGLGVGLALEGFRPFVEIMFGDFLMLASDQIFNHWAKFPFMYNNQVEVNAVVRTPMGGRRGYGPTHSQTLDRHFLGVPGLRVLAISNLIEPEQIYRQLAIGKPGPTLVIENKVLYGIFMREQLPQGFELFISDESYPTAYIKPRAAKVDYTLVGYGGMSDLLVQSVERIFEEHDLIGQVVCPTQIYPWNAVSAFSSIEPTENLVIVEEGQKFAGFGAEVISQLTEAHPQFVRYARRVGPPDIPIPASGPMEEQIMPGYEQICSAVLSSFSGS